MVEIFKRRRGDAETAYRAEGALFGFAQRPQRKRRPRRKVAALFASSASSALSARTVFLACGATASLRVSAPPRESIQGAR